MAASFVQESGHDPDMLVSNSQPTISLSSSKSNKRSIPDSPDHLPATQKQNMRQIKRRNSVGDLRDIEKKTSSARKTVTDKVLEALTSPDVLNTIIPLLAEKNW